MCLATVTKTYSGKNRIVRTGWKVFAARNDTLQFEMQGGAVKRGKWLRSGTKMYEGMHYQLGFHIFTRRKDTALWYVHPTCVVLKVKYRGILATGIQQTYDNYLLPVVVAREIWVPRA